LKRFALLAVAVLALAGCAYAPPPVSEKVQQYYDEHVNQPAALPTPEDPLKDKRADGELSAYFIGDSLTDGWNASDQPKSYRPMVISGLEKDGPVAAAADYKAGATLAEVAGVAAVPATADLVVLELGTNDVNKTNIETFRAGLNALVTQLATTKALLVCVGTWQFGTTLGFDGQIQQACEAAGGRFVKISDLRENPAMVAAKGTPAYPAAADGAHPNDAGHAEIARRVLARIGV
jgi:lysophospholipase L1-like esterase